MYKNSTNHKQSKVTILGPSIEFQVQIKNSITKTKTKVWNETKEVKKNVKKTTLICENFEALNWRK